MERSFIGMAENSRATAGTIALLTLISILGQLSIGLYTPSLPSLTQALSASAGEIKLTMTVFLASFAVAQLFWGAFSDRFGRRPILFAGVAVYLAGTIICLTAGSIDILIAGRFIQGIGACVGITISRAVVRDRYAPAEGARAMSRVMTGLGLVACLSAPLGGLLAQGLGWRAALATLVLAGSMVMAVVLLRFKESLQQRRLNALQPAELVRTWLAIGRHPRFLAFSLVASASNAGLFTYLAT